MGVLIVYGKNVGISQNVKSGYVYGSTIYIIPILLVPTPREFKGQTDYFKKLYANIFMTVQFTMYKIWDKPIMK